MSLELVVGPPASGKTKYLLEKALELTAGGGRVWWLGLPSQRSTFYRRATRNGPVLGLEFQTLQQLYYRLLAHAQELRPLLVGTGRLALVGEVLLQQRGSLPSPGEARLFAEAIAEAKRFGLSPERLPAGDEEVQRLRRVYEGYEALKGEYWDYDDFRSQALALAEEGRAEPEADALFVDGFRELGPLELRLLTALSRTHEVRLALPEEPPGLWPGEAVAAPAVVRVSHTALLPQVFQAASPVAEARWVLRSLKRDLAQGIDPLDLAVILPEGLSLPFMSLSQEYGVPVMDESPFSLADTPAGRVLVELLELPDHPTPSGLLQLAGLGPLASSALRSRVAGRQAIDALAGTAALVQQWRSTLAWLEDAAASYSWAQEVVDRAIEAASGSSDAKMPAQEFRRIALERAKEASRVAEGQGFRHWWAGLLRESTHSAAHPGAVALLSERLASGRRFRRVYLMRANDGAYGSGEREDYFVPEESRSDLQLLLAEHSARLPLRFRARDRLLFEELRSRGEEVIVTFPQADQDGPLSPEARLFAGRSPSELPVLPAGSPLEAVADSSYRPSREPLGEGIGGGELLVEDLRCYHECAMRYWLCSLAGPEPTSAAGHEPRGGAGNETMRGGGNELRRLIDELTSETTLRPERLGELATRFPAAAAWFEEHRDTLVALSYGVSLPAAPGTAGGDGDDGTPAARTPAARTSASRTPAVPTPVVPTPVARLHAAVTEEGTAYLYRFVPAGSVRGEHEAQRVIGERWSELWAAGHLLESYRTIERVRVFVWPLLARPLEAYPGGIDYQWRRVRRVREEVLAAAQRMSAGVIDPSPGFLCRSCTVRDACREAAQ